MIFLGREPHIKRGGHRVFYSLYKACEKDAILILSEGEIRKRGISDMKMALNFIKLLFRTFKKIDNKERKIVLVTLQDYLAELLPAILIKILKRKIVLVVPIYHLVPYKVLRKFLGIFGIYHYAIQSLQFWLVSHFADAIITENTYIASLIKQKNPKIRTIINSPGIPKEFVNKFDPNIKKDIDAVYVGALSPFKGIWDVLDAWKYIDKKYTLYLVGYADDQMISSIKRRIEEYKMSNVILMPNVSEEDKFGILARARIMIFPSYADGIPISFYEAWAFENIIVTYYLPSYIDIKDLVISAELGNIRELSSKIEYALDNYERLKELAKKGREYALNHIYEHQIEEICKKLEELNKQVNGNN